jgi:hypothetical protein
MTPNKIVSLSFILFQTPIIVFQHNRPDETGCFMLCFDNIAKDIIGVFFFTLTPDAQILNSPGNPTLYEWLTGVMNDLKRRGFFVFVNHILYDNSLAKVPSIQGLSAFLIGDGGGAVQSPAEYSANPETLGNLAPHFMARFIELDTPGADVMEVAGGVVVEMNNNKELRDLYMSVLFFVCLLNLLLFILLSKRENFL